MGKHIAYLDNLRTFAVLLSILCIAAGSLLLPPVRPSHYVFAGSSATLFLVTASFYEFCMTLIVPVLFFLSGYFSAEKLRIHMLAPYFKGRWQRLGWPLLVAVVILMPAITWLASRSAGSKAGFMHFIGQNLLLNGYSLGVYGFLALLLLLTLGLMAAKRINHKALQHTAAEPPSPFFLLLFVVVHFALVVACFLLFTTGRVLPLAVSRSFWNLTGLQPSWLLTAVMYFILGVYAFKHRWFTASGYVPGPIWTAAALVCCFAYNALPLLHPFIGVILSFTGTLGLIAAFARWNNQPSPTSTFLAAAAYPIWYLSEPVLETILYFLLPLAAAPVLKVLLALVLTLIYGWVVYKYALCHLRCFKTR